MHESTRHIFAKRNPPQPSSNILRKAWNNAGTTNGVLHSLSISLSTFSARRRCILPCCNSISASISRASRSIGNRMGQLHTHRTTGVRDHSGRTRRVLFLRSPAEGHQDERALAVSLSHDFARRLVGRALSTTRVIASW